MGLGPEQWGQRHVPTCLREETGECENLLESGSHSLPAPRARLWAAAPLLLLQAVRSHCWQGVSTISHLSDSPNQCSQLPHS